MLGVVKAGLVVLVGMLCASLAQAEERRTIIVGGYEFPPYVELGKDGHPRGLTLDLLALLNASQERYQFTFLMTSPPRRYRDFARGSFDMIAFESPEWGWDAAKIPYQESQVFFEDSEVYVAVRKPERSQAYFDDFTGKRMAGILGYHYGFAGFKSDPAMLKDTYHMVLVTDHAASIEVVLRNRADVAVVTKSYLARYFTQFPDAARDLLVSDKVDQIYRLQLLARPESGLDSSTLNGFLDDLGKDGRLKGMFVAAGVLGS